MAQIELPRQKIVELYNQGFMISVIARHFYITPTTLRNRLLQWGIHTEPTEVRQARILQSTNKEN